MRSGMFTDVPGESQGESDSVNMVFYFLGCDPFRDINQS